MGLFIRLNRLFSNTKYLREALFCAAALILGTIAGAITARYADGRTLASTAEYAASAAGDSLFATFVRIYRLPAAIALSAVGIMGAFLIPIFLAVKGYLASYSATLLIRCYSLKGFWMAASLYAVNNILVLPCLLIISVCGIGISRYIAGCVIGGGGRVPENGLIVKSLICLIILLLAVFLEYKLTPLLFSTVIN